MTDFACFDRSKKEIPSFCRNDDFLFFVGAGRDLPNCREGMLTERSRSMCSLRIEVSKILIIFDMRILPKNIVHWLSYFTWYL